MSFPKIRIDYSNLITNSSSHVLDPLVNRIIQAKKGMPRWDDPSQKISMFKIGITDSPKRRSRPGAGHRAKNKELLVYQILGQKLGHQSLEGIPWCEMVVVLKTMNYSQVQAAEKRLIDQYYWKTKGFTGYYCWNERGGGAGHRRLNKNVDIT